MKFKPMHFWGLFLIFILFSAPLNISAPRGCPFCDPFVWERQQFYEDAYIRGLEDNRPLSKGHRLIIPKRHLTRLEALSDAEIIAIKHLINRIKTPHYLILQKNNLLNSVAHVHVHLIPKPAGEPDWLFFLKAFTRAFQFEDS